jgi:hypothetical protein
VSPPEEEFFFFPDKMWKVTKDFNMVIGCFYGYIVELEESGYAGVWRRPLSEMTASVGPTMAELPHQFLLDQNYPNLFNPNTTIKFEVPKFSTVRLSVFDMLGRQVSVLMNEKSEAGVHEVKFDGSNLASGAYFYRLQAGDFVQSNKLVLLK